MPRASRDKKIDITQYSHPEKERLNNPPVGLVSENTDSSQLSRKKYHYDPHLDPQLQWAGKTEHTSFEVPTVSLHVHERIDPRTIIKSVQKKREDLPLFSLFETEKKPLREAVEFYHHKQGWSNRLVAGDSLLVMNSLLEKEAMAGKVQMIYFDPPYGIKYGSNFQPFTNKRDVKDGKDEDLSAEPEMIKAFRDTWELGIHSYLSYLRDRLLLARELLTDSGSIFVQISDENVHLVRCLMDEVFGVENFVVSITFQKKAYQDASLIAPVNDFILWYAKDKNTTKCRHLFTRNEFDGDTGKYNRIISPNGEVKSSKELDPSEIAKLLKNRWRLFREDYPLISQDPASKPQPYRFKGKIYNPPSNRHWSVTYPDGLDELARKGRIRATEGRLYGVRFWNDNPLIPLNNFWSKMKGAANPIYVVQTTELAIFRCLLMTTDPGDLVLDITCGSGTTAYVAEQWGRRWITCDTSRVAITLAKQRLMTAVFDYYKLAYPDEGVSSGFNYKTVPHITMKSIANNEPPQTETLYDQPLKDNKKARVTGPFTVEAVPAPRALSLEDIEQENQGADESIVRSGETQRQAEWRNELLRTGIRTKGGQMIEFTRVEPLGGTRWIQAEAETREAEPKKVLVVFGPEHAPLEQRTVENAWQEARAFEPDMLLFCAFQFDEEAAKDIDELKPEVAGMQLLKAQMNADLFTEDLKKKRASNESFWLIGQPDVKVKKIETGENQGKFQVEVMGFDYYNPKTGNVESGGKKNIAMWLLDTDYDERSLFPTQVFFPLAGSKDGWSRLAKNLKAEIDTEKIEAFRGTVSLPFSQGDNRKIAIKIIDDRGIESLRVISL